MSDCDVRRIGTVRVAGHDAGRVEPVFGEEGVTLSAPWVAVFVPWHEWLDLSAAAQLHFNAMLGPPRGEFGGDSR